VVLHLEQQRLLHVVDLQTAKHTGGS
jgi:hypothetical protein